MNEDLKSTLSRIEQYVLIGTKQVLTIEEAAILLGMKPRTVKQMIQDHAVPTYKPRRGLVYFKKNELEDWMLQNRISSQQEIESQAEAYCLTHK